MLKLKNIVNNNLLIFYVEFAKLVGFALSKKSK